MAGVLHSWRFPLWGNHSQFLKSCKFLRRNMSTSSGLFDMKDHPQEFGWFHSSFVLRKLIDCFLQGSPGEHTHLSCVLSTPFDSNHLTCGNIIDLLWRMVFQMQHETRGPSIRKCDCNDGGWSFLHLDIKKDIKRSGPQTGSFLCTKFRRIGAFCSSQESVEVKASPSTAISPKNILGPGRTDNSDSVKLASQKLWYAAQSWKLKRVCSCFLD